MAKATLTDWRSIEDDREKYQAYLCSHEWAKLKTAVHERAGGICERCGQFPINAVHHLTYARKYAEAVEDLAGWCKNCHNFTHDKDWFDPQACVRVIRYFRCCVKEGRKAAPFDIYTEDDCGLLTHEIVAVLAMIDLGTTLLHGLSDHEDGMLLEGGLIALDAFLPFKYYGRPRRVSGGLWPERFYELAEGFGCGDGSVLDEWKRSIEDEE